MTRRRQRCRRAGFTILEVMVASTLATLAAFQLYKVVSTFNGALKDILVVAERNRQADETMRLLLWGRRDATGESLPGLWQFSTSSSQASFPQAAGRAYLSDGDKGLGIGSPRISPISIDCQAPAVPLPDCTGAGESVSVSGFIHSPPTISAATAIQDDKGQARTRQLSLVLFNPAQTAQDSRLGDSTMITQTTTVTTHVALRITD
jgi:hypothetical protein